MSWIEGLGEGWRGASSSGSGGNEFVVDWKIFSNSLSNWLSNGWSSLTVVPFSFELGEFSSLRSTSIPLLVTELGPVSPVPSVSAFAFPFPLSLGTTSVSGWRIRLHNSIAESYFGFEGETKRSKITGVSGYNSWTRVNSSSEEPT